MKMCHFRTQIGPQNGHYPKEEFPPRNRGLRYIKIGTKIRRYSLTVMFPWYGITYGFLETIVLVKKNIFIPEGI